MEGWAFNYQKLSKKDPPLPDSRHTMNPSLENINNIYCEQPSQIGQLFEVSVSAPENVREYVLVGLTILDTQTAEAGGSQVQGMVGQQSEMKMSLSHAMKSCLNLNTQKGGMDFAQNPPGRGGNCGSVIGYYFGFYLWYPRMKRRAEYRNYVICRYGCPSQSQDRVSLFHFITLDYKKLFLRHYIVH